jgi:hypothetical protein
MEVFVNFTILILLLASKKVVARYLVKLQYMELKPETRPNLDLRLASRWSRTQSRKKYFRLRNTALKWIIERFMLGSLKMNTALEYSTRVVQEGDRRCKKSTLNDLAYT